MRILRNERKTARSGNVEYMEFHLLSTPVMVQDSACPIVPSAWRRPSVVVAAAGSYGEAARNIGERRATM
jgi:hypothetical protein